MIHKKNIDEKESFFSSTSQHKKGGIEVHGA